jgi:hypothetical protein
MLEMKGTTMGAPMTTYSRKTQIVDAMVSLIEGESIYCPYTDAELARRLNVGVHKIRYYRNRYLNAGNAIDRRAEYAQRKKKDN